MPHQKLITMNEYIKNDKRELIFYFLFFGKIGD